MYMIKAIKDLMFYFCQVLVYHVYREKNYCVDILTNSVHDMEGDFIYDVLMFQ